MASFELRGGAVAPLPKGSETTVISPGKAVKMRWKVKRKQCLRILTAPGAALSIAFHCVRPHLPPCTEQNVSSTQSRRPRGGCKGRRGSPVSAENVAPPSDRIWRAGGGGALAVALTQVVDFCLCSPSNESSCCARRPSHLCDAREAFPRGIVPCRQLVPFGHLVGMLAGACKCFKGNPAALASNE